uniref:RBR-type E3 ubiquitin transferase n=1 Tax=Ditylenchus dipsaci TaxID=166011 RepID=A0A915ET13_9BILA
MLRHTDWNKDKLLEKLFDNSCEIIAYTSSASSTQSSTGQCCEICFEEKDDQLRALQCKHYFCNNCWTEHITSKISVGLLKSLLCPASKCSQMIGDQLILELLHNHFSVRQLYGKIVLNQFVECTKSLKWCPGQDCDLAIQACNSSSSPKQRVASASDVSTAADVVGQV